MVRLLAFCLLFAGTAIAVPDSPPASAAASPAAEHPRVLGLIGAPNFRDIGGYETADGHHVRWGQVYRSNALNKLSATDAARVDGLHLAAVIDLRTEEERSQSPSIWLNRPADVVESPKPTLAPVMHTILGEAQTPAGARAGMTTFYADMPDTYRTEYAAMFRRVANGELPLLVHCTAGKDRTGVAAAVLLRSLGVPRRTVVEDYEMTDSLLPAPAMVTQGVAPAGGGAAAAALAQLPVESRMALWQANAAYIDAALDSIDHEYGSVNAYLTRGLGLSDNEVRAVRRALTD